MITSNTISGIEEILRTNYPRIDGCTMHTSHQISHRQALALQIQTLAICDDVNSQRLMEDGVSANGNEVPVTRSTERVHDYELIVSLHQLSKRIRPHMQFLTSSCDLMYD